MPDTSARLGLPYLAPAQAQKHVTVNEGLTRLDALAQLALASLEATDPPASPANGETHALGAGATGAWAGQDGKLAYWDGTAWLFVGPRAGMAATDPSGRIRVYDGALWRRASDTETLDGVGIGTSSDPINRLSVVSAASLFSHEGAGHQMKLNKAGAADTASLLYQTDWSGRDGAGGRGCLLAQGQRRWCCLDHRAARRSRGRPGHARRRAAADPGHGPRRAAGGRSLFRRRHRQGALLRRDRLAGSLLKLRL